jgi:hypothetical protein
MTASALPHQELIAVDARLEQAVAKPVIVPDTIVRDRGKARRRADIFLDRHAVRAALSGYTGRSSEHRGADVPASTVWSIEDLQARLDDGSSPAGRTTHDGLSDPGCPQQALT